MDRHANDVTTDRHDSHESCVDRMRDELLQAAADLDGTDPQKAALLRKTETHLHGELVDRDGRIHTLTKLRALLDAAASIDAARHEDDRDATLSMLIEQARVLLAGVGRDGSRGIP